MQLRSPALAVFLGLAVSLGLVLACGGSGSDGMASAKVVSGRKLFFDEGLSEPVGQSCASCHAPGKAFTDPRGDATSEGAVAGLFGARNAPTASYAVFAPAFRYVAEDGTYAGGLFLDGRVNSLGAQAQGPPLNAIEMHNPDKAAFVAKVAARPYAEELRAIYGQDLFEDAGRAYAALSETIAAFERSREVSPFSSKYDAYLGGAVALTDQERRGLRLFNGRAGCAACHPSDPEAKGAPPLFTDFTYDNIGVPKNPANRFYTMPASVNPDGAAFVDIGLAGNAKVIADGRAQESRGKFKVPTLRNIAETGPYMHNGAFASLKEVVAFYNRRDAEPGRFGAPETPENVNREELGNLGLSEDEEDAVVAFLRTLTDGYKKP